MITNLKNQQKTIERKLKQLYITVRHLTNVTKVKTNDKKHRSISVY